MGERISLYAGPPVAEALAYLGESYAENRSGRINTVCERYLAMVAHELRSLALSRAEWCAIFDANNGVVEYLGAPLMPSGIWANVHDSTLGEKWGIDQRALVGKLQRLTPATLIAIQEACDRFWSRAEMPTDAALAACGIKPADPAMTAAG